METDRTNFPQPYLKERKTDSADEIHGNPNSLDNRKLLQELYILD